MRRNIVRRMAIIVSVIVLFISGSYIFYKIRVDTMPGFVFGRNWKFVPETELPLCIPDSGTLGQVNYLNPPCYASGNDVFF